MKIAFYVKQFYLHGGIEKTLSLKINYFIENLGFDVSLIIVNQRSKEYCYQLNPNTKVYDLGISYKLDISYYNVSNIIKIPYHIIKLRELFKKIRPDVFISSNFGYDYFFLPLIASKFKLVREHHSSRMYLPSKKFYHYFSSFIEKKYDLHIVLNEEEKKTFESIKNVRVIPNSVILTKSKADLKLKRIIAAGRIHPVKGFDLLIKSWHKLYRKYPDWKLSIYGDDYGGNKIRLQSLIKELGLIDSVEVFESTNELEYEMLNSSIYALSSRSECFPMVLLESLSLGLPIIAYDCPSGPKHIITNNSDGILVKNGDIVAFAQNLDKLMNDIDLRLKFGFNSKINVNKFSIQNVMLLWENELRNLTN